MNPVNDGNVSAENKGATAGFDAGFKNLIYDLYSKYLLQKVKTSKMVMRKKGEYIGLSDNGCLENSYR